jgi:3-hydroxybutyryl-CoA dehydrogenase
MSTTPQTTNEEQAAEVAPLPETLAVAGSGTIACGLAAVAARHGEVLLLVRSAASAERARASVDKICSRLGDEVDPAQVKIVTEPSDVGHATYVVEAIVENHEAKSFLLGTLHAALAPEAVLATTTSSLSIDTLGEASGRPERFAGLHVFNPVPRMQLVELVYPTAASAETRERSKALCDALGKTAVEVPDIPGFVVNRLLFPFLFSAVRLLEETGMDPVDIDTCMTLGAGHPMGPLALLDLVGLDVSLAIGETIGEKVPERVYELINDGALGRKAGRGFHTY